MSPCVETDEIKISETKTWENLKKKLWETLSGPWLFAVWKHVCFPILYFLQMFVSFPTFYKSLKKFSFLSVSSFFIVSKNGKKSINVLLKLLFIIVYMFFLNTMLISKQNGLEVCTKNTFFCVLPLLAISLWVTRNIFLNIEFWWNFEANCQIL